ncbi:MAG: hypothetical protein GWO20_19845 [Candidatus Korarchaeota archaeon]|nr:hypothetical protein [Candidatus Korarchaeota archaeon]NIW15604.1 hypothetical protein [Candidatus Thorarchaeota archaeon]NIW53535.1 hypothetical protein [Candidatus Korarchaeota archaeon]
MMDERIDTREGKIKHLKELLEIIFFNLGRIVMDLTQPIKEIEKIRLFEAIDFQISLAQNLLERISNYPAVLHSEKEKGELKELKKKIEAAKEVAKEIEKDEIEEL